MIGNDARAIQQARSFESVDTVNLDAGDTMSPIHEDSFGVFHPFRVLRA
jgi:hypothetical protein